MWRNDGGSSGHGDLSKKRQENGCVVDPEFLFMAESETCRYYVEFDNAFQVVVKTQDDLRRISFDIVHVVYSLDGLGSFVPY